MSKKNSREKNWGKNLTKKKRNLGESYINATRKLVPARCVKSTCGDKCRPKLKCADKIVPEQREIILKKFWAMGDENRRHDFVAHRMSPIVPKYRYLKTESSRSRGLNFAYYFEVEGIRIRVCKTYFMNTLSISNTTIATVQNKKSIEGIVVEGKQGKHQNHKQVNASIKDGIREHINSFPRMPSHYCRAEIRKEYIDGSLNVSLMYRLYKEKCIETGRPYA